MLRATVKLDLSKMTAYEKRVETRLDATAMDIADVIVRYIRDSWSPESPSAYGTAPAVVTGTLDRSVTREKTGRTGRGTFTSHGNAVAYVVKAGAPHAGILEDGPLNRPFMGPALQWASNIYVIAFKRVF